ncbi:hypothetical protein HPB47_024771 [Ixodes persulcatus]|uniref:Uncharacterized protein n=1 Tax=Ixodes persulcatus TaxID=34615 RepID=A0AC60Q4M7_IXOPE|nr:hypothetical protein HPB47_024771 [Ixodes persulcatus]
MGTLLRWLRKPPFDNSEERRCGGVGRGGFHCGRAHVRSAADSSRDAVETAVAEDAAAEPGARSEAPGEPQRFPVGCRKSAGAAPGSAARPPEAEGAGQDVPTQRPAHERGASGFHERKNGL